MHDRCQVCGASFRREQGFYLGSIYINYAVTVLVTGAVYALLAPGLAFSQETTLAACLTVAVAWPVLFFRHARSFLLALDGSVNRHQQPPGSQADDDRDRPNTAALAADDGRAGCAMGIGLALILLFGLAMAAVTIWFASAHPAKHADAVDLR